MPTATKTDDGWICNTCNTDVFAGCKHDHGEWECLECGEWSYPFYYDFEDGCQHCGSEYVAKARRSR